MKMIAPKKSQRGEVNLIGLLVGVAVAAIVSLATVSLFSFGMSQFAILVEQNQTEENVLLASYYLKSYLSQSLKMVCLNGVPTDLKAPNPDYQPAGLGQGKINCNNSLVGAAGVIQAFALFNMEEGGAPAAGGGAISDIRPTGIFYCPPGGTCPVSTAQNAVGNSGVLYFAKGEPGGGLDPLQNSFALDRLVDLYVVDTTVKRTRVFFGVNSVDALKSLDVYIKFRYFKNSQGSRNYKNNASIGTDGIFRDIEFRVPINFRDNFLGKINSLDEYLYGQLYFFQFSGPALGQMGR